MNERMKLLRTTLKMSQEEFGKLLGITKSGVSEIESGRRKVTEQHLIMLHNHKINDHWIRTGEGEMFKKQLSNDEISEYIIDLLEYDGKGNPLYDMIIDIMRTYAELDNPSKKAIRAWLEKMQQNAKDRKARSDESIEPIQDTPLQESNIEEQVKAYRDYLETKEKAKKKLSS